MKPGESRCAKTVEGLRCMKAKGHTQRCEGYYLVGDKRVDWWVGEAGEVARAQHCH